MLRTKIAALTLAGAGLTTLLIPATSQAAARHSDFYVQTSMGTWTPEDSLSVQQLNQLANSCQPVKYAVAVQLTQRQVIFGVHTLGTVAGGVLIAEADATGPQIDAASANQFGLNIPSFIGPTSYGITASGYAC